MSPDFEHVLALADEATAYDGVDPLDEATRLALRHQPERIQAWVEEDGFALLFGEEVQVVVHPAARRDGVGRRLLDAALASAPPNAKIRAWSHGDHPAARALAADLKFARDRELWVMRRRADQPLPEPTVPDGVVVREIRPGDEAELLRVNAAAFADHPEQGLLDAPGLAQRRAEPWYDPAGLLVAMDAADEDRMLGFHWTKRHSPEVGEVYVLGIDPHAQGKGLGKALTLAGLHHLEQGGAKEVLLYVESNNVAAIKLYRGLGFSHAAADTHVQYRKRR